LEQHEDGLEALIFTAEGDMRQAINNLQATATGFKEIRKEFVFKVCDVPDIDKLKKVIDDCITGDFNTVIFCHLN
jgi:replication factor C subunit 2/4